MTRDEYNKRCAQRWYGFALREALSDWNTWREMHEYLEEAMRQFLRNSGQVDQNGKYHNPSHSLRGFLWNCQAALQPSRSRLDPFLDFEEHYQKIFLRRGLIIYCEGILNELEEASKKELPLFEGKES